MLPSLPWGGVEKKVGRVDASNFNIRADGEDLAQGSRSHEVVLRGLSTAVEKSGILAL